MALTIGDWLVERWRWWNASKKERAAHWCSKGIHEPEYLSPYPAPVYERTLVPGERWDDGFVWRDLAFHYWRCRNCGMRGKEEATD